MGKKKSAVNKTHVPKKKPEGRKLSQYESRQKTVERTMILVSMAAMDIWGKSVDEIYDLWTKTSRYADFISNRELTELDMEKFCEEMRKRGMDIHWRW